MTDLLSIFNQLKRPKLLIRAARFGAAEFRRDRDLKRLLQRTNLPKPGKGMVLLIELENRLEDTRKSGDGTYSITKHVEILSALIAEAGFLKRNPLT